MNKTDEWDIIIDAKKNNVNLNLKELWSYRDLLRMFVKKDIITVYKQTILGPFWFILQPVLTTVTYVFIFGNIAKIDTGGVPQILFWLSGITLWSYFSDTLNITSRTFIDNSSVFGKVYFPRIIIPLSKILSGVIKFLIQFSIFFIVWIYYIFVKKTISADWLILLSPLFLLIVATLSFSIGILITSMTTKYRDLSFLLAFGIQLFMYATPVIYPLSYMPVKYRHFALLNPLTSLFEAFKYGFLGKGFVSVGWLLYSFSFTVIALIIGIFTFNKVERRFIDTV